MSSGAFNISLKYRCQNCSVSSVGLKISPTGLVYRATIPTCCVKCGEFRAATVSMTQQEALEKIFRLETARADRVYQIDQKIDQIKKNIEKLLKASSEGHPHPKLQDGISTLKTQIDECEADKMRHTRLLSEDLAQCQTHLSRLRENGVKHFSDRNCTDCKIPFVPLWPLPWEKRTKKIESFPCPKCQGTIQEEVVSV